MVDYSKWNNIDCSDSEEEDYPTEEYPSAPTVTKLDGASSVTFGGGADQQTSIRPMETAPVLPPTPPASTGAATTAAPMAAKVPCTTNGGTFVHAIEGLAGVTASVPVFWSQTKDEVDVYVTVPAETKGPSVQVDLSNALGYADRNTAIGAASPKATLSIGLKNGPLVTKVLPSVELPHPVYVGDADDSEGVEMLEAEWEVVTVGEGRFVKVTLKKAVPMEGMALWWNTCIVGGDKIDVNGIKDR
jgi:hypothetical protein